MTEEPIGSQEPRNTMRRLRHAVRTPIGQIVGYCELLQEEVAAAGHDDWLSDLERIRQAGLGLLALMDEILGGEPVPPKTARDLPSRGESSAAARAGLGPRGARLLVVDDEEANRDLLARRLAAAGYQVSTTGDGQAALRRIESEPIDLVLLDVLMPGTSGLEVLEAIRREHPPTQLPVILATALGGSDHVVEGLRLGANDYVTKPLDFPIVQARVETQLAAKRAHEQVAKLAQHLEIRNAFIRRVFGRYVSDEIVDALLEDPAALELRGESREVTVLTADLRGFSSLTAECSAIQVLTLLNHYLGAMSEVIQAHHGIIDDFFGDGILAFFGAPVSNPEHAAQAVRCAVAMQVRLRDVNRELRGKHLPPLEMGIGIDTGPVVVGSIGSEKRSKYGAIGLPLNLASRIESCTLGGEILISDRVLEGAQDVASIDLDREIHPKGFDMPLRVHRVVGIFGRDDLRLPPAEQSLVDLPEPLSVRIAPLEGKHVGERELRGWVRQLSLSAACIECEEPLAEGTDVRIAFPGGEAGRAGSCYAKVVASVAGDPSLLTARFTARPSSVIEHLRDLLARLG
jgi:adenylate cyclase